MTTQTTATLTAEAVQEVAGQFAALVRFNAAQPDTATCEECGVDLGIPIDDSDYQACEECIAHPPLFYGADGEPTLRLRGVQDQGTISSAAEREDLLRRYGPNGRYVIGHQQRRNARGAWLPPRPIVRCHDCQIAMPVPNGAAPSYYHLCASCAAPHRKSS